MFTRSLMRDPAPAGAAPPKIAMRAAIAAQQRFLVPDMAFSSPRSRRDLPCELRAASNYLKYLQFSVAASGRLCRHRQILPPLRVVNAWRRRLAARIR